MKKILIIIGLIAALFLFTCSSKTQVPVTNTSVEVLDSIDLDTMVNSVIDMDTL